MRKSREEIIKQTGELVDLVGELFDEREETWRKFCKCSRDLKEVEKELAKANFKIEKAIEVLKDTNVDETSVLLITSIDYAIHILKGE